MAPPAATAAGRRNIRTAQPSERAAPRRQAADLYEPDAPPRAPGHSRVRAGLVTQPVSVTTTLPPPRPRPQARPSRRARTAAADLEATLAPPRPRGEARAAPSTHTRGSAPRLASRMQTPRLDRIVRGRAWIPVLGTMLILVVGLRVEVLKLGSSVGAAVAQATTLQSSNAVLRAQISALSDNQRIERIASAYGMHMPNPLDVHFLQASAGRNVGAAIRAITPPSRMAFLSALAAEQQHDALTTAAGATLSAVGASVGTPASSATTGVASSSTATLGTTSNSASSGTTSSSTTIGTGAGGAGGPTAGSSAGAGTSPTTSTGVGGGATGTSSVTTGGSGAGGATSQTAASTGTGVNPTSGAGGGGAGGSGSPGASSSTNGAVGLAG